MPCFSLLLLFSSCSFYLDSLLKIKGNGVDVENSRNILFCQHYARVGFPLHLLRNLLCLKLCNSLQNSYHLDINPVYKSPLDLTNFNGFCLVICCLSSVFLKSASCLVMSFWLEPYIVCSKSFGGDETGVSIFWKNLIFIFTVRFIDPGLALTQHFYFLEKHQPLYWGN